MRSHIVSLMKEQRDVIFRRNKFFEFLADSLSPEDMTFDRLQTFDASIVLGALLKRLDLERRDFVRRYLAEAKRTSTMDHLVPERLVAAIEGGIVGWPK